jgi:hypothetical protein
MQLLPLPEGSEVHPTDPYDPVGAMPIGKWKGQAVDTSLKRPAKIVWEDDKQLLIANFRDGHQFHQAHIQKDGVDSVYFRINRFPGPAGVTPAHTLLYFKMKHGSEIILEGENNAQDLSHPHAVSDFVVSTDFAAPKHAHFDLINGLAANFMTVTDFTSAYDYSLRGSDPNFQLEYIKLNLNDEQKNALLQKAVHVSAERGYSYVYDTLLYNCTTAAFELLDKTLTYPVSVEPFVGSIFNVKDPVAGPSEDGLLSRGLVDKTQDGKVQALWTGPNETLQDR